MEVRPKVITMELDVKTKEEALTRLANMLVAEGCVETSYTHHILKREHDYPTGLPTKPHGIALPHTDCEYVRNNLIVFASLKEPIMFKQMGNSDCHVRVSFIFMVVTNEENFHLKLLSNLINRFQDKEFIELLAHVNKPGQLVEIIAK